ncbi:hypothetical protein PoB_004675600 [Plakobranchus ocellatus]|uniref:Uncharacterized protein n=1 Tax=Plakobranchus ocellatus TaxID=259542 RepID=A0AAV4BML2_9GAST|nr:hypothetical protein PoB_004675600 [Plakobranchus ocellatus]
MVQKLVYLGQSLDNWEKTRLILGLQTGISAVKMENKGFKMQSPRQDDLRLSEPSSGQGTGGGARNRDRRVPADRKAGFLSTSSPTLRCIWKTNKAHGI